MKITTNTANTANQPKQLNLDLTRDLAKDLTKDVDLTKGRSDRIYIDVKHGTVPLTVLIDVGNKIARAAQDGQQVIIQVNGKKTTMTITLTRLSYFDIKEDIDMEVH